MGVWVKLKSENQTNSSASSSELETAGHVSVAIRSTNPQHQPYTVHISKAEEKNQPDLTLKMPMPFAMDATSILRRTPQNTTNGKSIKKAKTLSTNSS